MIKDSGKEYLKECCVEDKGILNFLFPQYDIVEDFIPPFLFNKKVIVISSSFKTKKGYDIINIQKNSTKNLNNFEIFKQFMIANGIKFSKNFLEKIDFLPIDERWYLLKTYYYLKKFPNKITKKDSIYKLFEKLFQSFEESVQIYFNIDLDYKIILSSLITMMSKTTEIDLISKRNKKYALLLKNNKLYLSDFKKSILNYFDSNRSKIDFLCFLYSLSLEGRLYG